MANAKTSRTVWRIVEGLFVGGVIALNVDVLVRGIATDRTVQVPVWAYALLIVADAFTSYRRARLLIWLAKQFWRGVSKLWSRR